MSPAKSEEQLIRRVAKQLTDILCNDGRLTPEQEENMVRDLRQQAEAMAQRRRQWPLWRRWGWSVANALSFQGLANMFNPDIRPMKRRQQSERQENQD